MNCYNVTCKCNDGNTYDVGVMTYSREHAFECAAKSLLEGRHLEVVSILCCVKTERI